jgi:hypothetical protein
MDAALRAMRQKTCFFEKGGTEDDFPEVRKTVEAVVTKTATFCSINNPTYAFRYSSPAPAAYLFPSPPRRAQSGIPNSE